MNGTPKRVRAPRAFQQWENYLPGDKAAEIWLALHRTRNQPVDLDTAAANARFYALLTTRLSADLCVVGVHFGESHPVTTEPQNQKRETPYLRRVIYIIGPPGVGKSEIGTLLALGLSMHGESVHQLDDMRADAAGAFAIASELESRDYLIVTSNDAEISSYEGAPKPWKIFTVDAPE